MIAGPRRNGQLATPAVTIVLIVHNTAPWLAECIRSIAGQTLRDFEVVVVDVASNLATKMVLLRHAWSLPGVRPIVERRNIGGAAAANRGIRAARGRYVFLMDSDDVLPPNALAALHRAVQRDDLDIAIGRALSVVNGKPTRMRYSADLVTWSRPLVTEELRAHPELTMAPYYWGRLYRRSLLLGDDVFMQPGRMYADRYFTCKALRSSRRTGVIPQLTYLWRRDRGDGSHGLSITQRTHSLELLDDRIAGFRDTESLFADERDRSLLLYVRRANLMRLFIHAKHVADDPHFRAGFMTSAGPYAASFGLDEVAAAPFLLARHKVQWYLTAHGRGDDLAEFLTLASSVPEPRTDRGANVYDYGQIVAGLPPELCAEPQRRLGALPARLVTAGDRAALAVDVSRTPDGVSYEPLCVVFQGRTLADDRRIALDPRAHVHGEIVVPSPDDAVGSSKLAFEYLAAGRVCRAPITIEE